MRLVSEIQDEIVYAVSRGARLDTCRRDVPYPGSAGDRNDQKAPKHGATRSRYCVSSAKSTVISSDGTACRALVRFVVDIFF